MRDRPSAGWLSSTGFPEDAVEGIQPRIEQARREGLY